MTEKKRRTSALSKSRSSFETSFFRSGEAGFSGYVFDPADLGRVYTVDLLIDGMLLKTAIANQYVHELSQRRVGNACYGFSISLDSAMIDSAHVVEARLSNLGFPVGAPVIFPSTANKVDGERSADIRWLGGLRFCGWVHATSATAPTLDVIVDGAIVSRIKALGWTHVSQGSERGHAVRAFDVHLPERLADGRVHRLTITKETGESIGPASLTFVAFEDGLARSIANLGEINAERLRGVLFDRLLPMSVPIAHYESWVERFPLPSPAPTAMKGAIILVGPGAIGITIPSLEEQTHDDWVATSLLPGKRQLSFEPDEANAFLETEGKDCDFVVFALSGTLFFPNALARIADVFNRFEDASVVYGDVDIVALDGGRWPLAFPAFDYERMLEQGYCANLFATRRAIAKRSLARGSSDLYRLFNSAFDQGLPKPGHVVHLPGAQAIIPPIKTSEASELLCAASSRHLAERGINARVMPGLGVSFPAATVARPAARGKTTVIIPTRNRHALLQQCLDTIRPAIDKASAEILIVDNDSTDPATLDYLDGISNDKVRVFRAKGPFNFARLNNLAARAVTSDYLCLLNNDVEAIDDLWLEEMLGRIAEPDVGAVGALLLWPSGVVQHGGVVLGSAFSARHAFNDRVDGDPGPADLLRVARECSAVTAACLLTRRDDYLKASGMDEVNFSVAFNDVDYCLKLRAMGKRIVFTPHARLWHLESASRGHDDHPDRKSRYFREVDMLRARWGEALMLDPGYSPVLSLDPIPYSALAWPPRSLEARWPEPPVATELPYGY